MKNFLKDFFLFSALFVIYFAGRLVLLKLFNANGATPSASWIVMSLRFDLMTSSYIAFPTAILTLISVFSPFKFERLKIFYASFAIFLSLILSVVGVCYFSEYKSQFNYWLFGLFFDDFGSILNVIWKDYPIVWISLGVLFLSFPIFFCVKKTFARIDKINLKKFGIFPRIAFACVYTTLLVLCMRGGSFSGRPLQLRDTAVENSEFLNNLIPSCAYCLKSEIMRFINSSSADGLSSFAATPSDIPYFTKEIFKSQTDDIDKILTRRAKGSPLVKKPSRIFIIMSEGHSAWGSYQQYSHLGLMPETAKLYKGAVCSQTALPSGGGTMASISSLVSGIPYSAVDIRGVEMVSKTYAIAPILKRLGYSSTFFYAGQSTWMRIREYCRFNGFDKFLGGESMGNLYGSVEWGLRDKDMFNFILNSSIAENTVNMILTVSNHPPFDVDLKAEGCPIEIKTEADKRLWHLWYADKQIGIFCKKIREKYPDCMVVITGDHPARERPQNEKMTSEAIACVPIIFTSALIEESKIAKEIYSAQLLDIIPTLVEMLASEGFEYKAWGENMLSDSPRLTPAITPFTINFEGKTIPIMTDACPPYLREFARKYYAVAYFRSIQRK